MATIRRICSRKFKFLNESMGARRLSGAFLQSAFCKRKPSRFTAPNTSLESGEALTSIKSLSVGSTAILISSSVCTQIRVLPAVIGVV